MRQVQRRVEERQDEEEWVRLLTRSEIVDGDFIGERPTLAHPALARPTAFLGDIAVAPLLEHLRTPFTVDETPRAWSQSSYSSKTVEIMGRLWDIGVIVEVSESQLNYRQIVDHLSRKLICNKVSLISEHRTDLLMW